MCHSMLCIKGSDFSYVYFFISVHFYIWQMEIFISVVQLIMSLTYLKIPLKPKENMGVHLVLIGVYTQEIFFPGVFFIQTV